MRKILTILFLLPLAVFGQIDYTTVSPVAGDDYPNLQAKIKYCIKNGIKNLYFKKGEYQISKPLLVEDSGRFVQINLIGSDAAHFTGAETQEAKIVCMFSEGFAIGYQLARSSLIKGLVIYGQGRGKDTRFDVYSGISIDPYQRGNTSGSSGIIIRDCRIRNFTVGIILSQNGVTLNAENIHVENVSIDHVKAAYVTCQRQSKQNTVKNLICWDEVGTVFEGKEYGQGLGVMPYIDGANIAGFNVLKVFNYGPQLASTSAQKIFAETIHQIGNIDDGGVGVTIRDSYFDFAFYSFPAYHFKGNNVNFDNVAMRYYDDQNNKRIVIDGVGNMFMNGYADKPFLMKDAERWEELKRTNYYFNYNCIPQSKTRVVAHSELSTYFWLDRQFIDVENKRVVLDRRFVGKVGDYIDTGHPFTPIARITRISKDTLFIDNILNGFKTIKTHVGINGLK